MAAQPAGLDTPEGLRDICLEAVRLGICVFPEPFPGQPRVAPITVFSSAVPAAAFKQVYELGHVFNTLMDGVACDLPWLGETLRTVAEADPFVERMLRISNEIYRDGRSLKSEPRLHLIRSDYLPQGDGRLLQVEVNMISCAFAGLTERLTQLHDYTQQKYWPDLPGQPLRSNEPAQGYAAAIAAAHRLYVDTYKAASPVVVFLVMEAHERNAMDQRHLCAAMRAKGLEVTFRTLASSFRLDGDGRLLVDAGANGDRAAEVSVVYFRAAYGPEHFLEEKTWEVRTLLERSRAIKVPTLPAQLAGTKKVQQALSERAALERFLSPEDAAAVLAVCATQVDPLDPAARSVVDRALADPSGWVLKPQREGGGNNLHGAEIVDLLTELGPGVQEYVLMEKIRGPPHAAFAVKDGAELRAFDAVSELGIYHAVVQDPRAPKPVADVLCGAFLRTKDTSTDEGGVNSGYAFLDTPRLV